MKYQSTCQRSRKEQTTTHAHTHTKDLETEWTKFEPKDPQRKL